MLREGGSNSAHLSHAQYLKSSRTLIGPNVPLNAVSSVVPPQAERMTTGLFGNISHAWLQPEAWLTCALLDHICCFKERTSVATPKRTPARTRESSMIASQKYLGLNKQYGLFLKIPRG
ncbi:unnamed protein product [Rangifer tarandus platyrhynchus]|uniref:Uncharacterized protein n=1 Tax=Rangifer tarandus platyrhynchus TaxID=3082113 RepID=A0ABN8ZGA2_RANTA|nr:unnamed protein product [Rangifer tarandus platyrhynchus]